jgi:HAD superfamily hydrolase (TIGR01509 family)
MMNRQEIISIFEPFLRKHNYTRFDLKAVLFDMDGVLYDSMPAHAKSWKQTMDEIGINNSPEEFYFHEGRTGESTINILFQRELGRKASKEEIEKIYARKTELFTRYNEGKTIPGAKDVLELVKRNGLTPVLVTGSGQPSLIDKLNDNFPGIFSSDTMVTAFDVKNGKPHPEPFLMGLEKAGNLKPNQAIVIENAPLGTEAATKAGIFTIDVNTGPLSDEMLKKSGAQIVLHSMKELEENLPDLLEMVRGVKIE